MTEEFHILDFSSDFSHAVLGLDPLPVNHLYSHAVTRQRVLTFLYLRREGEIAIEIRDSMDSNGCRKGSCSPFWGWHLAWCDSVWHYLAPVVAALGRGSEAPRTAHLGEDEGKIIQHQRNFSLPQLRGQEQR